MKNSFEKCEVHLPFYYRSVKFSFAHCVTWSFHRGPIEKVDNVSPTSAQLSLSPNKYKLIWNIG